VSINHLFPIAAHIPHRTVAGNAAAGGRGGAGIPELDLAPGAGGSSSGGGLLASGTVRLANSIIATNVAGTDPDVTGTVSSQGFNLIGKSTGSSGWVSSDKRGTNASPLDPRLRAFGNYGGPTKVMPPAANSPAVDAGRAFGFPTDQRGQRRRTDFAAVANAPGGDGTDIGAVELTVLPGVASTPFLGTPVVIPTRGSVRIQAENFDNGGEGVAYHDVDPGNNGRAYRSTGVDLQATTDAGGGFNLGWTRAGEWLKYTVSVAATGRYDLGFRVASQAAGGNFHLEVDGKNVTGTMTVPGTGGWQAWRTLTRSGVNLTAGRHVVRLVLDGAGPGGAIGNFNYLTVAATPAVTTLNSAAATYVNNGPAAASNFGQSAQLLVKNHAAPYGREAWVKFNLSSVATIASAKLRLFGNVVNAGSAQIGVYSVPSTWTESTLTWNNRPTAGGAQVGKLTVSGTSAKWYEVDLTGFLKAEKAAGRNTVSIALRGVATSTALSAFASDETANGPRLVVTT
jgi:hypothetical protein